MFKVLFSVVYFLAEKELIKSLQYYSDDTDIMIAIPGPKKDSFYSSPIVRIKWNNSLNSVLLESFRI